MLFLPALLPAQNIYQFSGLVLSQGRQEPIPFVTVQVNRSRRGTLCNTEGFYSIPVSDYDTLYFSHIGYQPTRLVVAEYMQKYPQKDAVYIYAIHYLLEDSVTLPVVNIFPYDTPEELKTAIVNMSSAGSLDAIARANLSAEVIDAIIQTLPVDADERLLVAQQMYYQQYSQKNLLPMAAIDPLAAARMLQYVADRVKKKKAKDLNYWE